MMQEDKLFAQKIEKKFEFDEAVASVFDDMLDRSVPFYKQVQSLIISLIEKRARDGMRVLDLGASTGSFLLALASRIETKAHLVGVDNSQAMVTRAEQKAQAFGADVVFRYEDMRTANFGTQDIIVANYTLQFIRPMERPGLVSKIYEALDKEGCFFFSEKVTFEERRLDKETIDLYYDFKRAQGYSDFEIAQKREALENVLIPFTIAENIRMCKAAGFAHVDTLFQWGNFVTFLAQKK